MSPACRSPWLSGFGVQGRGAFYDATGCLRDVVENHLFQVVALLAMDAPANMAAADQRNEKVKVFRSMRPLTRDDLVRGQYVGYRKEAGVALGSDVETYCAARIHLDSWRWDGVPWYIRAGKRLAVTATEVIVQLKPPPQRLLPTRRDAASSANYLRFRLEPGPAIAIAARLKRADDEFSGVQESFRCWRSSVVPNPHTIVCWGMRWPGTAPFSPARRRRGGLEVVDPILKRHAPAIAYQPGGWGPKQADALLGPGAAWHNPRKASIAAGRS